MASYVNNQTFAEIQAVNLARETGQVTQDQADDIINTIHTQSTQVNSITACVNKIHVEEPSRYRMIKLIPSEGITKTLKKLKKEPKEETDEEKDVREKYNAKVEIENVEIERYNAEINAEKIEKVSIYAKFNTMKLSTLVSTMIDNGNDDDDEENDSYEMEKKKKNGDYDDNNDYDNNDEEFDSENIDEIPLPNVSRYYLEKIIQFCEFYKTKSNRFVKVHKPIMSSNMSDLIKTKDDNVETSNWYIEFLNMPQDINEMAHHKLFTLMIAANYMDIDPLLQLISVKVASMLKGKTTEEIRNEFNIENDFTQEEEDRIKEEQKWCMEN